MPGFASCETSVPFRSGEGGYHTYRIPAITRTANGDLLAFAEGRVGSSRDHGDIDIVMKRSTDGGLTWGDLKVVAENGAGVAGNPSPVALDDGRILLLYVQQAEGVSEKKIRRGEVSMKDGRRVWITSTDDQGETWCGPREITSSVKKEDWRWYATGPGHGIQLQVGEYRGRIVVPANHSIPPGGDDTGDERQYNGGHCLISDDGGETWEIGYTDSEPDGWINVNETTAAELPDGRIYFNCRNNSSAPGVRADAYSSDGGQSLGRPFKPQPSLMGPVCQGSVLNPGVPEMLLYTGPMHTGKRALMMLRASFDQGKVWQPALLLSGLPAAYSDLVYIDPLFIGVLYETGESDPYETVTFQRIRLVY
ncbi:sialidase family protein [Streptomyces sp. 5-10]|uniref:sialidase family protein n=1 Tax=Streptomyces sp. 5-10 TaxID=878925 RepID=UPI00168BFCF5|nr:exo-alpha-sialidase [Streptomyces sp. 5-10]